MSDLISRQDAIDAIEKLDIPEDMCAFEILSHIELAIGILPSADQWTPCSERLPNEDEITYNQIGVDGEKVQSDRVLAIDSTGFIRCGYFRKSLLKHEYHGKGKRNEYSDKGIATWEFGEHYDSDPQNWVVPTPTHDMVAWMPLPEPWKGEEDEN